ncbi:PLD nuclease N-terminal domain-containing protein [Clostridium tagluense]|uniref:PLDc N-terminal domain-containing protein n=1 Tax=Clostridium tagluense TaxID=360422 RepID=UPI001C0D3552|nr:PLDc N-terminal domain-containing protein [Clostridium tagluense]MBU3128188.1 PLD nuclease N-terminal domain-containing protein [Clostridium tagluense]MCB2299033.1 PLD nuclease N-terminal domain-containing protein [Clostridium tagluense]MCB2312229.1 PLD nuclease N-terminal domain-containing protein [Clostridium tagluense]MCB2316816.1 PLD nuclease N-terminal domain-containing protein [Clostridium tagluense]MCB2321676.1 PLD nuclease N-terminal domain-containing protein [Clostridium tagluense]
MFEGMALIEIIKLLAPIIILEVVLVGFCLYRLTRDRVKFLPKWAWALIILFIQLIGGIAFLLIGRERD